MAEAPTPGARTEALLEAFVTALRRRQVSGSLDVSRRTASILRHVIADARTPNPADLIVAVRAAGARLTAASHTGASASSGAVARC
jgi:translation initiation factor 2B subunit (eIF-2B alpha/beta/delta family)